MTETWRPSPSYPHLEVSSLGRVRSIARRVRFLSKLGGEFFRQKREKLLKLHPQNGGYLVITFEVGNTRLARTVHSLVAEAFLGPRPEGYDICHENGIRKDNRVENLRYDTRKNNFRDRIAHNTIYDGATQAKLTLGDVKEIRALKGKALASDVADMYFLRDPETIRKIWRNETWKYA